MTILIKDAFTDTDNTPLDSHIPDIGNAWIKSFDYSGTQLIILNNKLVANSTSTYSIYKNTTPIDNDCYAQVDIIVGITSGTELQIRSNGVDTFYMLSVHKSVDMVQLRKKVGGVFTVLGTFGNPVSGTYKITAVGNVIRAYFNGGLLGSAIDNDIISGYAALEIYTNTTWTMDNLEVGNFILPAVPNLTLVQSGQNKNTLSWTL